MYYYEQAAKQELPEAQNELGQMYELGLGIEQDDKKAGKYYKKAAKQGHSLAQYNPGNMYAKRTKSGNRIYEGVKKWLFKPFAEALIETAKQTRLTPYQRYTLESNSYRASDEEVVEADKKAFYWYKKAAARGIAEAQFKLGEMYEYGNAVDCELGVRCWYTKNYTEAMSWYELAALHGLATAQFKLGLTYETLLEDN